MLGFNDAFFLLCLFFVALVPVIWFIRRGGEPSH
jgi:hypothetical protein